MRKKMFTASLLALFTLLLFNTGLKASVFSGGDDFEASGKIQSIGTDSLVVNNVTFFTDSTTEVRNQLHTRLSLSDLHVNDQVEIKYVKRNDSTNFAVRITLKTAENEFEISGEVQSIGSDSLVVRGLVFHTDSTTVIRGRHDTTITLSDIKVNDLVEIHAVVLSDSSLLAKKIHLESETEMEHKEIELEGIVNSKIADTLNVNGTNITVNNQTQIFGADHTTLTYNDITVGMRVEVKANLQPDSTYLALRIKVEAEEHNRIEVTAPIDSLLTNGIIVSGVTFITDSTTEILDSHGTQITFSDLKKGMTVKVKGTKLPDGTYLARKIKVKDFWRPKIEAAGIIDTVGSDYLIVTGKKYFVDSQTQIYDSTNTTITITSLTAGNKVVIHAVLRPDSTLLAIRIKVVGTHETDLSGTISAISGDTLVVSGLTVLVDTHTLYFNEADSSITFGDLKVNQQVEVKALLKQDGSYLALIVSIEDDPEISETSGIVSAVTLNSVTVSAPSYQITSSTVVLDANFQPVNTSLLTVGQQVTVWSSLNSTDQQVALQIQAIGSVVTGIKDNTVVLPKDYKLSQNYPNPFNPGTNIRFTIPQQGLVTLKVYDILGKEIATLVNEVRSAGTYVVRFDGARLASGVYFYRIESGNFISTKKLILLK